MFLIDPPPSQGDLHFRVFGFPVRIHPLFWVSTVLLSFRGSREPAHVLIWVAVVLVSILVHELGHAFLQRHYGGRPWITLYAFGGMASCDDCDQSTKSQILIALAGPGAGFALAILLLAILNLLGIQAGVALREADLPDGAYYLSLVGLRCYWSDAGGENATRIISSLLYVNIFWGLINLLPIYPLDGGRVSRELCLLGRNTRAGMDISLKISIVAASLMAVYGLRHGLYVTLLFGYLAYSSYQTLARYRGSAW
ncbi:MAG: site-2 protease family protein [Planctomycetota bacterium]